MNTQWLPDNPDAPHVWYTARTDSMRTGRSLRERFQSFFTSAGDDECWPWQGKHGPSGHGQFSINNVHYGASRVAFYWDNHRWPVGGEVRHTCDNPLCVNPRHLIEGTQADNLQDMVSRGRHYQQQKTHCAPAGHPLSGDNLGINSTSGTRFCKECRRHPAPPQTHCKKAGHPLSGDNLGLNKTTGGRFCKECARAGRKARSESQNPRPI